MQHGAVYSISLAVCVLLLLNVQMDLLMFACYHKCVHWCKFLHVYIPVIMCLCVCVCL